MDVGESALPDCINPNHFPAKLWRLVNNPGNTAIRWDSLGEGVIINKHLFETQVLSPCNSISDNTDAFKTTNFSSFVRQLNLYGFRKSDPPKDKKHIIEGIGEYHHFNNPGFKRNHPELLASLRRLTADNKARIEAGQEINCRPPSKFRRLTWGDDAKVKNGKRESSLLLNPTHQELTLPYFTNKAQAGTAHNGTPVPPRYLIRSAGAALSPSFFAADKGMPVPLSHHYAGVASSSNALHGQQGLLALPNHGNAQYQPGYFSPAACHCHRLNFGASQITFNGLQNGSFSPYNYYQASYPANMFRAGHQNEDPQKEVDQEVKKCDINLDTIFQMADEVMQTPPNRCLVKVATPERPVPVLVESPSILNSSSVKSSPLPIGPIIRAVSANASLVEYKPPEVDSDDADDTEVIDVEVGNNVRDHS